MTIQIERTGRRAYILGNTYPHKSMIKDAGAKWDADRKAWWIGDAAKADALVASLTGGTPAETMTDASAATAAEGLADDQEIVGRATHKGKSYILVWVGETKRGRSAKLAFADGSKIFWAPEAEIIMTKRYEARKSGYSRYAREERMTFGRLRRLQAEWKRKSAGERADAERISDLGGKCRCPKPLDEGDGECMYCGYFICIVGA